MCGWIATGGERRPYLKVSLSVLHKLQSCRLVLEPLMRNLGAQLRLLEPALHR
jgi:hypothetical protein